MTSSGTKLLVFFFFNDTATTEIYTLSLHDALPISSARSILPGLVEWAVAEVGAEKILFGTDSPLYSVRSEEHTSELQSRRNLVCRLLLEKKK